MLTLALETSDRYGSVAISKGTTPLSVITVSSTETHSRRLIPAIEWLVQRAGVDLGDLECIAVSLGPGSFTGIRIGLATAKGLALSLGVPLSGVPTIDAIATRIPPIPGVLLCPVIDARRGRFYTSCYTADKINSCWQRILPFHISTPIELHSLIRDKGLLKETCKNNSHTLKPLVMFTGSALATCSNEIEEVFATNLPLFAPEHLWHPEAMAVAAISKRYLEPGDNHDGLQPIYVRPSQAEEKKQNRAS